ncbi:MAG: cytochrome P450 [Pseudonocardia sp.]|nr:cytochrome P450 [Pseudonocardia sp.]
MRVPDTLRWFSTHGLARMVLRREAGRGNLNARLLIDPVIRANPYPYLERLRAGYPFTSALTGKLTVHHDIATEVLRADDFGTASYGGAPRSLRQLMRWMEPHSARSVIEPPSMLAVDPPEHSRYRKLVTRAFTVKAVNALRERAEQIAIELLDDLPAAGPVDLVRGYAAPLPVIVICEILGAPTSMREKFLAWGDDAASSLDLGLDRRAFARAQRGIDALLDWMRGHFDTLRRHPGEDILSQLVTASDTDGERLNETELLATSMLVLAAGFETTVNLIANGIVQLDRHPDQRTLLAGRPDLWPNAVDEILRFDSPVSRTARRALRDTEVAGVPIHRDEIVVLSLTGSNRDPRVFAEPDRFDVTRPNAGKHLAFSSGIHHCLGASLARMEGTVALRALYERFPDLAVVGEPRRRPTSNLRGYQVLEARLVGSPVG